ncbi:3-oxo-tetronate kinase [Pollutimonas harenae]|uniref:3-oxo-tetronate kinase n=1 Tax=Pollutimonas harenae TaxID=657015 RepID=A0A853H5K2_9BURK|nr:3-oxo-tetronate kinase [Pollutimonas harenae]NYT85384.1 four-carbon acid sugar kinase family protein [Pollutimonas harenae]TEA70483.1 four-carbon acid sugar kinase family protein [Pollutimonas harenae]
MSIMLGCIADDFTGATDLAGMLVQGGMKTVQIIGIPQGPLPSNIDADAVVIALKSRTNPAQEAVTDSLAALKWLRSAGCRQIYFKYCSTFDSTDQGNIGPVTDALMQALDTPFTIACPAFPENGRTIFNGYLFVGDMLLEESGMRHHPLTPMTDSNLVRVLQRQTSSRVGLIGHQIVKAGVQAIRQRIAQIKADGIQIAVIDATSNEDLMQIGQACADLPLLTAGSGVALGLPQNFREQGLLTRQDAATSLPPTPGLRAIVCGSCSQASQAQLADIAKKGVPSYAIDPLTLTGSDHALDDAVQAAMAWAAPLLPQGPVVVYATASAIRVKAIQEALGTERAGALVEAALAAVAQKLVAQGVRQLIVAGGETSGAVVTALKISSLRIGPQIDPGVPWTVSLDGTPISLALKSGNFGNVDFFSKAWSLLP